MSSVKKIVIRFPNWLGDIIMSLPLIAALKKAYPNATIDALIKQPFDTVVRHDPHLSKVISFKQETTLFKKLTPFKLKNLIKQGHYDLAIICTGSISSTLALQDVPIRIGRNRFLGSLLLTHQVNFKHQHQRLNYLELLKPLGITSSDLFYPLTPPMGDLRINQPYVVLHPGASYGSDKTWPMDSYIELATLMTNEGYTVVFCGDHHQAKPEISNEKVIDLTGRTNLQELFLILKHAALVICNDSGPMHITDSYNTPLIALFGPTDPTATGPISSKSIIIYQALECSPCFKRSCPLKHHACMKTISPQEVFQKALTQLERYGSS
jgi:heptosyltransferase-2